MNKQEHTQQSGKASGPRALWVTSFSLVLTQRVLLKKAEGVRIQKADFMVLLRGLVGPPLPRPACTSLTMLVTFRGRVCNRDVGFGINPSATI